MCNIQSKIDNMRDRREVLIEMSEAFETTTVPFRECDDCHRQAHVVTDPSTYDSGEFEYCIVCVRKRFQNLSRKLNDALLTQKELSL